MPPQRVIDVGADHARLNAHLVAVLFHSDLPPIPTHLDQDPVADRLARQTGAGATEGERDARLMAHAEQSLDLLDRPWLHHRPRDQPVEAGVGGVGNQVDRPREDPLRFNDLSE
jgi:hypothetical protein